MSRNTVNMAPSRLGVFEILVNVLAFLYVEAVLILIAWEGLSRSCLVLAWMLMAVVVMQTLANGSRFPVAFFLPWLFFFYAVMSIFWSVDSDMAYQAVGQTLTATLGGTAIWQARNQGLSWKTIAWAAIIGCFVLIASSRGEVAAFGLAGRAAGLARNANLFAIYLAFTAFIIWTSPQKMPWWAHFLGVMFLSYGIVFSGSRKSLLILAVAVAGAIVWAVFRIRKPSTWAMLAAGTVFSIILFAYINTRQVNVEEKLSSLTSVKRMTRLFSGQYSGEETSRQNLILEAINVWQKNPIIGTGAAQFEVVSPEKAYAHSNYFEILADYGLLGFGLFYTLHAYLLVKSSHYGIVKRSPPHRRAMILLFLILLLDVTMVSYQGKLSWILLGLTASLVTARRGQTVSSPLSVPQFQPIRALGRV